MVKQLQDSFPSIYRDHVIEFLAELMNATHTATTPDAFQRAVQAYCDDLRPWMVPEDMPSTPRANFSLFAECTINEDTEGITVQLSPEGEAFFRAWIRRQAVMAETGSLVNPGWKQ
jgi:hypothetical protein